VYAVPEAAVVSVYEIASAAAVSILV